MPTLTPAETRRRLRALNLERPGVSAFAFHEQARHLAYDWHAHARCQLLYSLSGRVILESAGARWLLPPQRAAWIPAGMRHRTTLDRAETVSVFFSRVPSRLRLRDIRILRANPLLREMLVYAAGRWSIQAQARASRPSQSRRAFFDAMAWLCLDWIEHELPFRLPVSTDPRVDKAMAYLQAHLDTADIAAAARHSGQSVRTLRRRFQPATGMTWRQYRLHAAMLQAMEALLNTRASVLEIALAAGYESPSAFSKTFAVFTGSLPLTFRRSNLRPPRP